LIGDVAVDDGCRLQRLDQRQRMAVAPAGGQYHVNAGLAESANGGEGRHVVKSHQRREGTVPAEQLFGQLVAVFETGERVAGLGQVNDQAGIQRKVVLAGQRADSLPARFGIGQLARAADKGDLAVAEPRTVLGRRPHLRQPSAD